MALTSDEYQAIGSLNGRRPWFVRKKILDGTTDASNANDGKSPNTAKLTISGAVAVAASGDMIIVGPGTYAEAVDASALSLKFRGAGTETILTNNGAATLKVGAYSVVENMQVNNTKANPTSNSGIGILSVKSGVVLRNIQSTATDQCVSLTSDDGKGMFILDECHLTGSEYGAFIKGSDALVKDCSLNAVDWTICYSAPLWYVGMSDVTSVFDNYGLTVACLTVINTKLHVRRTDAQQDGRDGACLMMTSGTAKLDNCMLTGHSSSTATISAIDCTTLDAFVGLIALDNCKVHLANDGGGLAYLYRNNQESVTGPEAELTYHYLADFVGTMFSFNGQAYPSTVGRQYLPASAINIASANIEEVGKASRRYIERHGRPYTDINGNPAS